MKRIVVLSIALVLLLAIASSSTVGSFDDIETSSGNQLVFQWYIPPVLFHVTNDGTTDVGSEDKLFVYDENGIFRSNLSFLLAGTNATPSGVATADDFVYVLDQTDQRVYRYPNGGGIPQVSKYLRNTEMSALSNARGLAISGNELWLTRYAVNTPILYCYSLSDAFSGPGNIIPSTSISPPITGNKHPTGLAIDENYLYVLDRAERKIYIYHRYDSSVRLVSQELRGVGDTLLDTPNGLTSDGFSIWVVDSGTDRVYQYPLSSLFTGSAPIEASWQFLLVAENDNATGM